MAKNQGLGKAKKIRIDPLDVTRSLGYQTHRLKARKPWSKEEDDLLRSCVNKHLLQFGFENGIESMKTIQQSNEVCKNMPWDEIAVHFDRTVRKPKDIRKRWVSSLDPNLRKGKWTLKEDELLMRSFAQWGPHWLKVSSEIPGRTEDQCAKRYIEVLDPSTKDRLRDWRLEEDLALISKVKLYGTSWRKISLEMESRPSLTCRNRWRKIITMIMRGKASEEITKAVQGTSQSEPPQTLDELRESLRAKLEEMKDERPSLEEERSKENEEWALDSGQNLRLAPQTSPNDSSSSNNSQSESDSPAKEEWPIHSQAARQERQTAENTLNEESDNLALRSEASQFSDRPQTTESVREPTKPHPLQVSSEMHQPRMIQQQAPVITQPSQETQAPHQIAQSSITNKRRPHSSRVDWGYSLTDGVGGSVSGGLIANSELVQELIDQARRNSLTISIHQHIHNNYGSDYRSANLQGFSLTDELLGSMPPDGFGDERTQKQLSSRPFETEFLGRSPNFTSLAFDPAAESLGPGHGLPQHQYPNLSSYNQKPGNGSSIGSRSTPGADMEEMPPHRQYHFNYLPPTLKPQLSSSALSRDREANRSINHSPTSQVRSKRRKKNRIASSEENTPQGGYGSNGTTPRDNAGSPAHGLQDKTKATGGTSVVSHMLEEEDLDFWESLRSLATVPASSSHRSVPDGPLDEYDYLYNFYEEQVGTSPTAGRREIAVSKPATTTTAAQQQQQHQISGRGNDPNRTFSSYKNDPESVHRGLPFNPS
ncbi:LAME_0D00430g1_1 [Lachancea meyersii CBS 8951]|uniref:LAME_0D00430g1_1 n=1 Tax=Lachancea meyersii CBS 8951 TaxID=1266667 RepID=A0A1G4J611_9SACH|nr:LAME_0D00430g1_1 [Lachancea meyersii CBS 8951]